MAIRNFYARLRADGRKTDVGTGPSRRDGGLRLHLTQRDHGAIIDALTVEAYADGDRLVLNVFDGDGNRLHRKETTR